MVLDLGLLSLGNDAIFSPLCHKLLYLMRQIACQQLLQKTVFFLTVERRYRLCTSIFYLIKKKQKKKCEQFDISILCASQMMLETKVVIG